jgi:hypothetical protein
MVYIYANLDNYWPGHPDATGYIDIHIRCANAEGIITSITYADNGILMVMNTAVPLFVNIDDPATTPCTSNTRKRMLVVCTSHHRHWSTATSRLTQRYSLI